MPPPSCRSWTRRCGAWGLADWAEGKDTLVCVVKAGRALCLVGLGACAAQVDALLTPQVLTRLPAGSASPAGAPAA